MMVIAISPILDSATTIVNLVAILILDRPLPSRPVRPVTDIGHNQISTTIMLQTGDLAEVFSGDPEWPGFSFTATPSMVNVFTVVVTVPAIENKSSYRVTGPRPQPGEASFLYSWGIFHLYYKYKYIYIYRIKLKNAPVHNLRPPSGLIHIYIHIYVYMFQNKVIFFRVYIIYIFAVSA